MIEPSSRSGAGKVGLRYARSSYIFRQYDPVMGLYRVETGLIRLGQVTSRGRLLTLRLVQPGDYFGEDALHAAAYGHHAEALTNSAVVGIDPAQLSETALLDLARSLGSQLGRVLDHEVNLQSGDLKSRVVRYLLHLADTPLGSEDPENRLYVRATHELLAEGSGSTRESVSKAITELRAAGLIATGYRHITLTDLAGLRALLAGALQPQLKG
ncbi:Crp/Fnr family transcriptional regulator [Deinococcus psychrotolerans]|uniref:Crp/Fnr family transcriptional regulator n=1 Tax=Deinococcus psychrotolerans TaxID=2489213 RepID=A0A3G8YLS6_9DEIO|nr:helix-turn-helix domain-containing protein [Deinococcus psychrotolerans]AZI42086.1 Crp/Fnr family transcriptional regulator [Deinococcus psychrotolerans]